MNDPKSKYEAQAKKEMTRFIQWLKDAKKDKPSNAKKDKPSNAKKDKPSNAKKASKYEKQQYRFYRKVKKAVLYAQQEHENKSGINKFWNCWRVAIEKNNLEELFEYKKKKNNYELLREFHHYYTNLSDDEKSSFKHDSKDKEVIRWYYWLRKVIRAKFRGRNHTDKKVTHIWSDKAESFLKSRSEQDFKDLFTYRSEDEFFIGAVEGLKRYNLLVNRCSQKLLEPLPLEDNHCYNRVHSLLFGDDEVTIKKPYEEMQIRPYRSMDYIYKMYFLNKFVGYEPTKMPKEEEISFDELIEDELDEHGVFTGKIDLNRNAVLSILKYRRFPLSLNEGSDLIDYVDDEIYGAPALSDELSDRLELYEKYSYQSQDDSKGDDLNIRLNHLSTELYLEYEKRFNLEEYLKKEIPLRLAEIHSKYTENWIVEFVYGLLAFDLRNLFKIVLIAYALDDEGDELANTLIKMLRAGVLPTKILLEGSSLWGAKIQEYKFNYIKKYVEKIDELIEAEMDWD